MHPLFHLIATKPHLLVEHIESYAHLVGAEMGMVTGSWKRSAILIVVALCCLFLGLGLAGVAVMLWGVVPFANMPAPWVLWAVPVPLIVIGVICLLSARTSSAERAFENLRRQLGEDMAMLRQPERI